jgi:hypothetical protein
VHILQSLCGSFGGSHDCDLYKTLSNNARALLNCTRLFSCLLEGAAKIVSWRSTPRQNKGGEQECPHSMAPSECLALLIHLEYHEGVVSQILHMTQHRHDRYIEVVVNASKIKTHRKMENRLSIGFSVLMLSHSYDHYSNSVPLLHMPPLPTSDRQALTLALASWGLFRNAKCSRSSLLPAFSSPHQPGPASS